MTLVGRSFGEYYGELVAYEPTSIERIHTLCRDELGARRQVEADEQYDFVDMLHIAAIWISEKKAREKGFGRNMGKHELEVYKKQNAVWQPKAPPRMPEGCHAGFPKAAFHDLCEEEAELRRWLHGVEAKLREHIEHSCQESYYILTCFDAIGVSEDLSRVRIEMEEDDAFAAIKRSVFRAAPPDFYRRLAIERHGASGRPGSGPPRDLTFEEQEAYARAKVEAEEVEGRHTTHQYLVDYYDQLLFEVRHQEVFRRELVTRAEEDARYPFLARCCREDFGHCFYHTPAVFLHVKSAHKTNSWMAQMCQWHLEHTNKNAATIKDERRQSRSVTLCENDAPPAEEEEEEEAKPSDAELSEPEGPSPDADAVETPVAEPLYPEEEAVVEAVEEPQEPAEEAYPTEEEEPVEEKAEEAVSDEAAEVETPPAEEPSPAASEHSAPLQPESENKDVVVKEEEVKPKAPERWSQLPLLASMEWVLSKEESRAAAEEKKRRGS